ncbi:hypothetical protein Q1695_007071 [Nippostrongylus brasiliensis]|nr:hypothetical protein Q1695_007071 [Nippostrongylus brasiliensis]
MHWSFYFSIILSLSSDSVQNEDSILQSPFRYCHNKVMRMKLALRKKWLFNDEGPHKVPPGTNCQMKLVPAQPFSIVQTTINSKFLDKGRLKFLYDEDPYNEVYSLKESQSDEIYAPTGRGILIKLTVPQEVWNGELGIELASRKIPFKSMKVVNIMEGQTIVLFPNYANLSSFMLKAPEGHHIGILADSPPRKEQKNVPYDTDALRYTLFFTERGYLGSGALVTLRHGGIYFSSESKLYTVKYKTRNRDESVIIVFAYKVDSSLAKYSFHSWLRSEIESDFETSNTVVGRSHLLRNSTLKKVNLKKGDVLSVYKGFVDLSLPNRNDSLIKTIKHGEKFGKFELSESVYTFVTKERAKFFFDYIVTKLPNRVKFWEDGEQVSEPKIQKESEMNDEKGKQKKPTAIVNDGNRLHHLTSIAFLLMARLLAVI